MDFSKDLLAINKVVFKKSNKAYGSNLMLIPATWLYILIYSAISIILVTVFSLLGEAGGFLSGIAIWFLGCYILSDYFEHIASALVEQKFKMSNLRTGGMIHFRQVLTATAVPSILSSLLARLTGIGIPFSFIVLFLLLFAIPEIVYQKNIDGLGIFSYGYNFVKENWKHWVLVNFILGFIIMGFYILIRQTLIINIFNFVMKLLPWLNPNNAGDSMILYIIVIFFSASLLVVPIQYAMIYRGYLFKILSVSSKRKREYMRNIYGK